MFLVYIFLEIQHGNSSFGCPMPTIDLPMSLIPCYPTLINQQTHTYGRKLEHRQETQEVTGRTCKLDINSTQSQVRIWISGAAAPWRAMVSMDPQWWDGTETRDKLPGIPHLHSPNKFITFGFGCIEEFNSPRHPSLEILISLALLQISYLPLCNPWCWPFISFEKKHEILSKCNFLQDQYFALCKSWPIKYARTSSRNFAYLP